MDNISELTFSGRIRSVKCAMKGICVMITSQQNAWIHGIATLAVIILGVSCGLSRFEWCWITLALISVWTAEALNTVPEFLTDVASLEFHPVAAKAKDVAAGSVLIKAIGAILIGLMIFSPHLWMQSDGFK